MGKGQFYGMRIPLILIGVVLVCIGAMLLLTAMGMGAMLPFVIPADMLPATIAGISSLLIFGGVAALGALALVLGIMNPNMMFG